MKFLFFAIPILLLASCGGSVTNQEKEVAGSTPPASMVTNAADSLASNPVYAKGSELVTQYQCPVCHKVDEKLTGPAYREVANKYAATATPDTIARLAKKVIDGGVGVWGEVPMTPHPNVSMDDAKMMVAYIMLLKK